MLAPLPGQGAAAEAAIEERAQGRVGALAGPRLHSPSREVARPQGLDFCLGQRTSSPALSKGRVSRLGGVGFLQPAEAQKNC